MASVLSLDTINNATAFFVGQWSPTLKRNQSRDVLRLVLNKLYGASHGSLFHARVRCSQAALAPACGLSREWVNKLLSRLREAGWVEISALRLPDGKQEVSTFRPGRMLKRLLVMLLRSCQRRSQQSRVNGPSQKTPTKEEVERNKTFLAELLTSLSQKLGPPERKKGC